MAHLVLSLLGGFQAAIDDHPLTSFESNKVRALLAYLAVEVGRAHRRESLAALLWPEFAEAVALANLRVALSNLRGRLRDRDADLPFLLVDREIIQFNLEADVRVDVWELESAIRDQRSGSSDQGSVISERRSGIGAQQSTISNLQSAISWYRGPFLDGFSIPDSVPFEEWLILKCEQLHQQALRILHQLADFYESCGEYEQALIAARRQVELEPWLEEAHRQIMRLLAFSGQSSQALAQYETCKRTLADELGIEPANETTHLYEILRLGRLEDIRPDEWLPFPGESPYKGLHFFDEPDAALFFGREALTRRLVGHIREMTDVGAGLGPVSNLYDREKTDLPLRFLTIVGASGSGKSSVVRAGLVLALKQDGWQVEVITPTAHPLEMLGDRGKGDKEKGRILVIDQFEELFTLCRAEEERTEFLDCLLAPPPAPSPNENHIWRGESPSPICVFHMGEGRRGGWGGVVLVLRADFYSHCAQYPWLRQALCARQEYIGPMTAGELHQAIEQPALLNGWKFEPGLVELILRDVGVSEGHPPEPGALPLLEHALLETWQRRSGRTLTLKGYAEAGGVHGAIAKTAESVFARLTSEQQALVRRIFVRLTELGEGTQDTRRRASLSELSPAGEDASRVTELLQVLAEARLITLAADTVEVAHEALIREWPALREWLSEDREGLRLHRHLTDSAEAWAALEHDAGELYRGARLAQALEWAESHPDDPNALEREYLQASRAQAEGEAAEREAQHRRQLDAALKLAETERQRAEKEAQATAARAEADAQRISAEQQTALASARALAANASLNLEIDSQLSLLLAQQAVSVTQQAGIDPIPWDVQQVLHDVMIKSRLLYAIPEPSGAYLWTVFYSPDGKWLAENVDLPQEGVTSGGTRIREASTGQVLVTYGGFPSAISPDGKWIAVDELGIGYVKDFFTGERVITITFQVTPDLAFIGFSFSPDGNWLAWSGDGRGEPPRLWDLTAWRQAGAQPGLTLTLTDATRMLAGCNSLYAPMAFSPDGQRLATNCGRDHNTLKVWDVATGQGLWESPEQPTMLFSVDFSPDGSRIASCDYSGNVLVWDAATGKQLLSLKGFTGYIQKVTYSPDGDRIAAAGLEGVIVWNTADGSRLMSMSTAAHGVDFSPDGKRLAVGRVGMLEMWDVTAPAGGELAMKSIPKAGADCVVSDDLAQWIVSRMDGVVEFIRADTLETFLEWQVYTPAEAEPMVRFVSMLNHDATRLATARNDSIVIWDLTTRQKMMDLHAPGEVISPAFSPDGTLLVSGGRYGGVTIWDLTTGKELRTLSVPLNDVFWSRFSPDGTRLAVGGIGDAGFGFDNRIFIWDLTPGVAQLEDPLEIKAFIRGTGYFYFSPDGNSLVASASDGVKVFDTNTGALRLNLTGYGVGSDMSMYSPDGKYIVACWCDGVTRVYEAQTGIELLSFRSPGNFRDEKVSFTPDGQRIISLGSEGYLQQFAFLNFDDLVTLARSRVSRTWTQEECRKYLHRETCP